MERSDATPLVSVVMPAYNAERYIERAIKSVVGQTITDWELVVVDDCSSDSTVAGVNALAQADPRIRLFLNEKNMGVAQTRNRAIDQSRGEFVAFLDADDVWYADKLEKQIDLLKKEKADLVYTSYRLVTPSGEGKSDYCVPEEVSFEKLLSQNWIGCSTVLMSRALAEQFEFSTEYYHEDYVLWLQMLRQGAKMIGLPQVLVDYTYYPTSKAGNKFASAKHRWIIYRRCLRLPLWKSFGYLAQYALAGIAKYRKVSG